VYACDVSVLLHVYVYVSFGMILDVIKPLFMFYLDKVSTCVTIARICFVEAMPKWYYIACKVCGKKVQPYPQGSHGDAGPIYS